MKEFGEDEAVADRSGGGTGVADDALEAEGGGGEKERKVDGDPPLDAAPARIGWLGPRQAMTLCDTPASVATSRSASRSINVMP